MIMIVIFVDFFPLRALSTTAKTKNLLFESILSIFSTRIYIMS